MVKVEPTERICPEEREPNLRRHSGQDISKERTWATRGLDNTVSLEEQAMRESVLPRLCHTMGCVEPGETAGSPMSSAVK